ncbi:MAG: tetratricopeptide repeat protein [Muribaculaceae bacterium]|nr:tetratricopeptide repeat protein [Muribaculaceae bacterium]
MKRITLFIMLVAVLAMVAGAETKKKTIKSMAKKQQEQQQQVASTETTDYDWAIEACYHERFDEALTYINKHLKKNPNDPYGLTCLAAIQCQTGKDAEAEKTIAKASKYAVNEGDPEMLNWMYYTQSTIYLHQQDTVRAIDALNKAVEAMPGDVDCYMRLGNIYKKQQEYDLAMVNYGLAVQYDRKQVEGYLGLGTVASSLANKGDLDKRDDAIKAFTMALQLDPEFAECYALRAVEYFNDEEYDKSMDDIIAALDIERNNARALWALEYVKFYAHEYAEKALRNKAKKSNDNWWLELLKEK